MRKPKKPTGGIKARGFASMTPERRRELARKGGKSVAPENRAFSQSPELAKKAGLLGGLHSDFHRRRRAKTEPGDE